MCVTVRVEVKVTVHQALHLSNAGHVFLEVLRVSFLVLKWSCINKASILHIV